MTIIRQSVLIITPIIMGGIIHSLIISKNILPSWRIPLDGGLHFMGKRIFGDNKTLRGALIMIMSTAISTCFIASLLPAAWLESLPQLKHPFTALVFGGILGGCYIIGELPNSFIKRQRGIEPGQRTTGTFRFLWNIFDQADSVISVSIGMWLVYHISWSTMLSVLLCGTLIHILFDRALHVLRVKT